MNLFAQRMSQLQGEGAYKVLAQANALEAEGRSIVHLEIGQPNFPTPKHISEAAFHAISQGKTGYTASQGTPALRQAISEYCLQHKKVHTNANEVVVAPGAKPIIFYSMLALVEPGDEVIVPNPGFPTYASCVHFCGGTVKDLILSSENQFDPDPDQLLSLLSPKTKLVILNNPNNPTGRRTSNATMLRITELIRDYSDAYVLSDEIYDRLVFEQEEEVFSPATVSGMKERSILLDGFSKTYAMTGWRLGYGVMNPLLAEAFARLMVNSNGCTAAFTQDAGVAALHGPQAEVKHMKHEFAERSVWLAEQLNQMKGVQCVIPNAAFYVFPRVTATGIDSGVLADRILNEAGVACLDGGSFGSYGKGYLRMSTANSMENLQIAAQRLAAFFEKC